MKPSTVLFVLATCPPPDPNFGPIAPGTSPTGSSAESTQPASSVHDSILSPTNGLECKTETCAEATVLDESISTQREERETQCLSVKDGSQTSVLENSKDTEGLTAGAVSDSEKNNRPGMTVLSGVAVIAVGASLWM